MCEWNRRGKSENLEAAIKCAELADDAGFPPDLSMQCSQLSIAYALIALVIQLGGEK
ncbi:MAG: hypothetical protein ACYCU8_05920 [Ferrimicrobium acidiphilum]